MRGVCSCGLELRLVTLDEVGEDFDGAEAAGFEDDGDAVPWSADGGLRKERLARTCCEESGDWMDKARQTWSAVSPPFRKMQPMGAMGAVARALRISSAGVLVPLDRNDGGGREVVGGNVCGPS